MTNQLRVGLLGCGFMGKVHAEAWRQAPQAKLVAVAGVPAQAARDLAAAGGASGGDSLAEVIARGDVDAVDICLPTAMHEEFAIAALRAGKHVLCEKPLTLSLESADRILAAARESGRTFMVAQVVRFWPQYVAARQIALSGGLGEILAIDAERISQPPDWAPWFADPRQSGGAILDLGIHDLDYVVSILGRPKSVHSAGRQSSAGAWNHASTHLSFGGATAHLEVSHLMPKGYPFTTRLRIVGSRGVLEYDFRVAGNVESRNDSGPGAPPSRLTWMRPDEPPAFPDVPTTDGYLAEIEHFASAALAGRPADRVPLVEVRLTLEIAEVIRRSLETGQAAAMR
jgi:UDP-N-acetylglucosamine 3-dehydrogenase